MCGSGIKRAFAKRPMAAYRDLFALSVLRSAGKWMNGLFDANAYPAHNAVERQTLRKKEKPECQRNRRCTENRGQRRT